MVNTALVIKGPLVYTEHETLSSVAVTCEAGLIQAINASSALPANAEVLHFPDNYHLVPGFIDLHIHGANGCDVMDATESALDTISQALVAEGTTAFLATTMTADKLSIEKALKTICAFQQKKSIGAEVLGAHLEGPFLSMHKMGAQVGDKIIVPDMELLRHWQQISSNAIKLVTLAPEQPNSLAFIEYLKQQHIIPSVGHTNASYAETVAAISAGCCHATHLFNAMRGIHQREPGVVTAALLADEVNVELIVDGVHLHPAIVKLVYRIKGRDKIILVTDAMRAKCLGEGYYELGGQQVRVHQGQATLADGTLAGSVLPMSMAIKNMLAFAQCSLADAVKMASENPAKALGLFHRQGSIAPGKIADLVVLDDCYQVVLTICRGRVVYRAN